MVIVKHRLGIRLLQYFENLTFQQLLEFEVNHLGSAKCSAFNLELSTMLCGSAFATSKRAMSFLIHWVSRSQAPTIFATFTPPSLNSVLSSERKKRRTTSVPLIDALLSLHQSLQKSPGISLF